MQYRRLGPTGLQLSVLSLGSWVTFGEQFGVTEATECLGAAYEAGVNFFDNAESYAGGESERIMGAAIAKMAWPRYSYAISTKIFWGLHDLPNCGCPFGDFLIHAPRFFLSGAVEDASQGFRDGFYRKNQMMENLRDAGHHPASRWGRRGISRWRGAIRPSRCHGIHGAQSKQAEHHKEHDQRASFCHVGTSSSPRKARSVGRSSL